jgi:hypothetical protein
MARPGARALSCDTCGFAKGRRPCDLHGEFTLSRDAPGGTFIDPLDAFLISCPVTLRESPAVIEAWHSYRWYDRGALADRYPMGIPVMLCKAVEQLDAGYNHGMALKMRRETEKARKGGSGHDVEV